MSFATRLGEQVKAFAMSSATRLDFGGTANNLLVRSFVVPRKKINNNNLGMICFQN
jgi:hypothetical protein